MSEKLAFLGVAVLMAGALGACGQKGPLYLPDAPGEVVTRPAATPEATAPEGTPPAEDPEKEENAAPPPPL